MPRFPNEGDTPTADPSLWSVLNIHTVGPAELYAVSSSTTFFGIVRCTLQYSPPDFSIFLFSFFNSLSLSFSSLPPKNHNPHIMSAKSISEADGKAIINYHLTRAPVIKPSPLPASTTHNAPPRLASLYFPDDKTVKDVLDQAEVSYPWLLVPGSKFVAKPDQLIKRRGKSGLLALNKTWAEAREWIESRATKDVQVETVTGVLRTFLVEPFVPHDASTEAYICINSVREVSLPQNFPFALTFQ